MGLTYGDAQGVNGQFHNGSDRLAGLVNRIKVLEMPLLFAPSEGWCYVSCGFSTHGLPATSPMYAGYLGAVTIMQLQSHRRMYYRLFCWCGRFAPAELAMPEQEDANYNVLGYMVEKVRRHALTSHASGQSHSPAATVTHS